MNRHPDREKKTATWLALFGLFLLAVAFVILAALVMPQILGIVFVVGGFFVFCLMHYLVWGWWLRAEPPDDQDE